jgi:hypothetical protein
MVGSSIEIGGKASGFSKSAIVSPISKPSTPVTAQMSPQNASATSFRPRPSKVYNFLILDFTKEPSRYTKEIG